MPKPASKSHEARFKQDISENFATVLKGNANISTEAAMRKVTMDMLANNPFVPPTGCPVNDLPNELLAYIFLLGTKMEEEGEDMDDDDEDDEYADELDLLDDWEDSDTWVDSDDEDPKASPKRFGHKSKGKDIDMDEKGDSDDDEDDDDDVMLPFQVLVSHVCRHWREIAIESPALWTTLTFTEGPPFEKSQTYVQRSKGSPLNIHIDCTIPDEFDDDHGHVHDSDEETPGELHPHRTPGSHGKRYDEEHRECEHPPPFFSIKDLNAILDIIIPHVSHWRLFEITASLYDYIHIVLAQLAKCPSAPLLEILELYHYEDCDDYSKFDPPELATAFLPFHGIAPNLSYVALWGVHLDWEPSLSFLSGLRDLELAYHANDVRPSFATFKKLIDLSPNLRTLTLCLSGPEEHNDIDNIWTTDEIAIPSLNDLVICYHDCKYITKLMELLSTPNVHSLALDYDESDYSEFVLQLTRPMPGNSKSILAGLEHLKISGLPCDNQSIEKMFDQLAGLKTLNLNCSGQEEVFFDHLMKPFPRTKVHCPNLHTITTTGIEGAKMKEFVEARKSQGAPLKKVFMSEEDDVDEKEEQWLRNNLEELEFFEPSDSEESVIEVNDALDDDDEMDID